MTIPQCVRILVHTWYRENTDIVMVLLAQISASSTPAAHTRSPSLGQPRLALWASTRRPPSAPQQPPARTRRARAWTRAWTRTRARPPRLRRRRRRASRRARSCSRSATTASSTSATSVRRAPWLSSHYPRPIRHRHRPYTPCMYSARTLGTMPGPSIGCNFPALPCVHTLFYVCSIPCPSFLSLSLPLLVYMAPVDS